jgi:drug/metabolite transporter (DMT)-like permease
MTPIKSKTAYLELHTAVFLFGFTGILGKLIQLDAAMLVWHRLWMTAILMFIYVKYIGKFKVLPLKDTLQIAAISVAIVLHWILFYGAIKLASVSVAMICLSSITLFTALLEPIMFRKAFSPIQIIFSLLVIAGVGFMAVDQQHQVVGIIVGLASAFFSALFTVLNKSIVHRYDSRLLSLYEMGFGFLLMTPLLPLVDIWLPIGNAIPVLSDWGYLLLLSLFCTVVAFNLSLSSLRSLSAFTVNLVINLEPVYGIALAFLVFSEHKLLGPGFYIGSILIMATVLGEVFWKRYSSSKLPRAEADTGKYS